MSKINYELKSKLINSPIFNDYKKCHKILFLINSERFLSKKDFLELNNQIEFNEFDITIRNALHLDFYYKKNFPLEWKECERIYHAHISRVKRLKLKIQSILDSGECLFLTLTFNDNALLNTKVEYRRKAVQRYLNNLNCLYVANKDFGKTNHREHYHAVVGTSRVDYSLWKLGAINGLKIRNSTEDVKRIAKYVAKLTNHAIKATTERSVIMYSRKK